MKKSPNEIIIKLKYGSYLMFWLLAIFLIAILVSFVWYAFSEEVPPNTINQGLINVFYTLLISYVSNNKVIRGRVNKKSLPGEILVVFATFLYLAINLGYTFGFMNVMRIPPHFDQFFTVIIIIFVLSRIFKSNQVIELVRRSV